MKYTRKLTMKHCQQILRLHHQMQLSQRDVARALGLSKSVVQKYLARADQAGLRWPDEGTLSAEAIEAALGTVSDVTSAKRTPVPMTGEAIHQALGSHTHMTLMLVWQDYCQAHPDQPTYSYTRFCYHYRAWKKRQSPSMRQVHVPGRSGFIDYAGSTVPIIQASTGEVRTAQIFIFVLGASNLTYVEATWTQSEADFIQSHVNAFAYFGGVCATLTPDNLKAAVIKAHRYEPQLNRSYAAMAEHYATVILPARARKPRDKAKVENAVLVVSRWILARLRDRTFFSLAELNAAIKPLLEDLNNRPFKKRDGSRRSLFNEIEAPDLQPLPETPYEYTQFKQARVNRDYHIEVDKHFYSVPHTLIQAQVEVHLSPRMVTVYHQQACVATHPRSHNRGGFTTVKTHMPNAHQVVKGWSRPSLIQQAQAIGPSTTAYITRLLDACRYPEQAYRACVGVLTLVKDYGADRLEAGCERLVGTRDRLSYRRIAQLLKKGLDQVPWPEDEEADSEQADAVDHENIRGSEYYQ